MTGQFAWRSQKSIAIYDGPPSYESLTSSLDEESLQSNAKAFKYSPDGSLLAFAFDSSCLILSAGSADNASSSSSATGGQCRPLHTLEIEKVVDLQFSPRGRFLSTWQRPFKDADGNNAHNLHVWDCESGECIGSFERKAQQGCHFLFTESEDACLRMVTNELHVFDPKSIGKGLVGRLKLEGITSYEIGPGPKPSVAVFCGEKQGAPASVRIYPLSSLIPEPASAPAPVSQKTFFKADRVQMKWNVQGTGVLFVTSTDHDKTGKSYYGETNLYMMSTRGDFDCRVGLDKEGPVHDFEWNPNGREFIAVYGYMPAKCTLFSYRINVIAELGTVSRNFVSFNPQGRLFCLAGFGNLSGTVDVWDREKLGLRGAAAEDNASGKLFSFDASNSSLFQWSPDGQFILTATLSPRLRVENGVRIWHCTGNLVHMEMQNELYQASWRPMLPSEALSKYPFPKALPAPPAPSPAAKEFLDAKKARSAARPLGSGASGAPSGGGVYRPPGARNLPPGELRKIEEAANLPSSNGSSPNASGATTPSGGVYVAPGRGRGGARRVVPGAGPPVSSQSSGGGGNRNQGRSANGSHSKKSNAAAKASNEVVNMAADVGGNTSNANGEAVIDDNLNTDGSQNNMSGTIDKKIRNLNKKLKAIQELKERKSKGEKLEQTQLQKIATEGELRKELADLE